MEIRSFELRAADGEDFVLEGTAVSYDCLSQELSDFRVVRSAKELCRAPLPAV